MKLTFKMQSLISVGIILLFDLFNTVFRHWMFTSLGFALCGVLFLLHPVVPNPLPETPETLRWARLGGALLVFLGIVTRTYLY